MRGPFWNDTTGVTGEPRVSNDNVRPYESYTDEHGVRRTRFLDEEPKSGD